MIWNRSCHKYPCPETDHMDEVLNDMEDCTIRLTKEQLDLCIKVGGATNAASKDRKNNRVSDAPDEFINILGRKGECATCVYNGLIYQPMINSFRKADLLYNIEVRTATHTGYGLKVRPDENESRRMVLAITTTIGGPVKLLGWIPADEGKRIGKYNDPKNAGKPMYSVAIEDLRPMKDLRQLIKTLKESHG